MKSDRLNKYSYSTLSSLGLIGVQQQRLALLGIAPRLNPDP